MTVARQVSGLFKLWRRDILAWCADVLFEPPREWQPEILAAVHTDPTLAIVACRKAGKTRLAAIIALWWLTTRVDSLVYTVAPIWSQVEQAIWADIRHVWMESRLPVIFTEFEVLGTQIKTPRPKWRAIGAASSRVQNIEGRHAGDGGACVILDESKGIDDEFHNSVRNMLFEQGSDSLLVAIGTPGAPRGWFHKAFAGERAAWNGNVWRVRADRIPRLQQRARLELERLGEKNPWYRQQQLAEFAGADEFTLFSVELVEAAVGRKIKTDSSSFRIMALDPAGEGQNSSVLGFRIGDFVSAIQTWQGWPEMKTAAYTAGQVRGFRARSVHVDAPGLGSGIAGRIREILAAGDRVPVIKYQPGGTVRRQRDQFANRKAEDVFALRDRFNDGEISIPNNALLISQLTEWRIAYTDKGKTRIVDPEPSPDHADMLNILFSADTTMAELLKDGTDPLR